MSRWDDSDEEPMVATAPTVIPMKSTRVVKTIEDTRIAADDDDTQNEDDVTSVLSVGSAVESDAEAEEEGDVIVSYNFAVDQQNIDVHKVLNYFPSKYDNIIAEFADVEIFLISVDGLLIELTSHWYLNWSLGGQTIIIAKQIDSLLTQLSHLGGKFKLVWMTDLIPFYAEDTVLNFLRSFVAAHLAQSRWAEDIESFSGPLDPRWSLYLQQLTPSFLMIAVADASERVSVNKELKFGKMLACVALNTLAAAIPIVHFNGLVVNLCSVYCHRVEALSVDFKGWDQYMEFVWSKHAKPVERCVDLSAVKSTAELWAKVIASCKKKEKLGSKFDRLASAVLIAALVGGRRGTERIYLPEVESPKRGFDHITHRRALLNACAELLDTADFAKHPVNFSLADLWDGRLIMCIFDEVEASRKISPYRIQNELAPLHKMAALECSLEVDTEDRLFDAPPERKLLISSTHLLPVTSDILNKYAQEWQQLVHNHSDAQEPRIFELFNAAAEWPFHPIQEEYARPIERVDEDYHTKKHLNKQRQFLSRWFESFAQSLEGRGSNLLVDFSRTPRGFAAPEEEAGDGKKKEKQQWQQKGKGGKGKKEPVRSKKELILEANKSKKSEKLVENEKQMIMFATMQGKNAVPMLENLMSRLELEESRARCVYEQMVRVAKEVTALEGAAFVEQRRVRGVALVGKIKQLLTTYWNYLDEHQKDFATDLWVSLGFEKSKKRLAYDENRLSLNMNMVYYQLAYGGELIDIQSDPQRDSRVTGFHPDAWQRKMLDAVDRYHSAVIVAPTSAGKTFVSYYCIERVLRQSDDDMVVYVSPSKALLNQVCGSVYARFRNKALSGGKSLFGTLTQEFADNTLNCQVLITVPECLEGLLMSCSSTVQAVVSKIKYVIFDEVHCISASPEAHIWEHLLLLIRCPFLALSATIGNAEVLHEWLQCAEHSKTPKGGRLRKVELIRYGERYSELELCMQRINENELDVTVQDEQQDSMLQHFMPYGVYKPVKLSMFGIPDDQQLTARQILDLYYALAEVDEKVELIRYGERYSELELCMQRINENELDVTVQDEQQDSMLQHFMPYGVYKPVKLSMFGIPDDQQLTARQILDLYYALAEVDEKVREELEPCKFFNYHEGGDRVWLSRADLRRLENALKMRFLNWLKTDQDKVNRVLDKLGNNVQTQLAFRSKPFDQRGTALRSIVPLIMELRDNEMLPAICFNDDRKVCERLAERLFEHLEEQQKKFEESAEYRNKYEIKDEEKMMKLAKRKRDAKEKKKTTKTKGDDKEREEDREPVEADDSDPLAAQRLRLNQALERFKLRARQRDEDLLAKMKERLNRAGGRARESTKQLLRLFERGIGYHHQGLTAVERGAVEILFRSGQLAMVFSTSTLALGMNMPCKTVIFGVDTPMLTPLQFRQMSGRAGRRGYDRSGTVIFMSIPTAKIRRLLTASLSTLRGNLPFTTSFVLRLFSYVHQKGDYEGVTQQTNIKGASSQFDIRLQAALTLLENSFTLFTRPEMKRALQKQIRLFTLFSVQLLRSLDLLNEKGEPHGMAPVVCHLSAHEPGNLLFAHLLQNGVFHRFCKQFAHDRNALKSSLVVVFANLFTNRRLPLFWDPSNKESYPSDGESKVFLDEVPKEFTSAIEAYNAKVENLFKAFMQLSSANNSLQGNCFSLAGNPDSALSAFSTDIVRPLHDELIFDEGLVPACAVNRRDHRGKKIWLNAYAADFWRLESKKSLERNNNISDRETWFLIHDFSITLEKMSDALSTVGRSKDPFVEIMKELSDEYDKKFRGAFGMKQKY
ncbi:putative helicase C28H8.3 [Toxocara canis]|uniref:Putative helicase C28H8.3 n=1 Tax=Toxocara canis TaxID=6265 RepID=A0A0B2W6A1_TOXCA|nr:putative helicase C28H8.3 [Toxocara canis]